jgi:RNA polymerase sigma-70 factor (ECF subfamily)
MKSKSLSGICEELIFSNFFKSHVKALRNFMYYKFGNAEQAEDVTQEAFIKLWENCEKVPLDKAKSYLYTIANNTTLNQIAHQKVVLEFAKVAPKQDKTFESPDFHMEENEFKVKLQKAIANLTEGQRTCFLMHRIDGKKYSEIADALGISVKAVEKRMHLALLELRKEIDYFK